jgi:hypothetical protein
MTDGCHCWDFGSTYIQRKCCQDFFSNKIF